MMSRTEKRYNWTEDILTWGHGKYTREQLESMNIPALSDIYNKVYYQHILEMQTLHH